MKKFSLQGILEIEAFGTYLEEYMTELISSGLKIWNLRNENGIIYFNCQRHKYKKIVKKAR